ncbi:MAG: hypothetical protein JXX14_10410 [Deltaproteobacteria bacterium]|nr:hypothetical protein [Deltaproteobacteria bacterium]
MEKIARLEQIAADLYEHFANIFSNDVALNALFSRMKREEMNHKSQVLLQKRLSNNDLFEHLPQPVDLTAIDQTIDMLREQLSIETLHPKDALEFAIMFESQGIESAYRGVLSLQNVALAKLAKALSAGDDAHVKRLKEMRQKYE